MFNLFQGIFYFLLNMSIISALIIILFFIIRTVFGRWIGRNVLFSMWWIALFRMLIPVSLPSSISLINLVDGYITRTVAIPKPFGVVPDVSILNSIKAASQYFPLEYKSGFLESVFRVSGIVWVCGAVLFILSSIIIYNLAASRLREAVLVKDNGMLLRCRDMLKIKREVRLYESGFVDSPVVFGIINPRIIIPKDIPGETLYYALLHELSHIRRRDNLWKVVSILAVCIHWFNPIAWFFLYISAQDMEFACDELVLNIVGDEIRKPYASALAALAAKQRAVFTSFGGTAVRRRIIGIVLYKRVPLLIAALTAAAFIVFGMLLVTNPSL